MPLPTAFVGHPDCSRHDTGWKHPEHQGRLPALTRAVYRDMLTLHDRVMQIEARPATEAELRLVHTPEHIRAVHEAAERAARAGETLHLSDETAVSAASWAAALAAVGCALAGVDVVLAGEARNAFCAARPPGHGASAGAAGGFSLFNNVAIAVRYLQRRHGAGRVLVAEWGAAMPSATPTLFADDPAVRFAGVRQQPASADGAADREAGWRSVPVGASGDEYEAAFRAALDHATAEFRPEWIVLSAGFDALAEDPIGDLALVSSDFHPLTMRLAEYADAACAGRLVSVLEGGYASAAASLAVVQHLRALAGLAPA